ncbi:MAG TPA: 5-carboxymethyl-2-hydroxymuconate Delta-isomerase [Ignavibacteriaceae bacterium]|nr:5-carboxymethyl-2-hydroxymuconate Delta-isomerase [Ignavibacteriaceae bacterium]
MPHCTLEYSDNVLDKTDDRAILKNIHDVIIETKMFSLNDLKSRTIVHHDYLIGDGDPERAFVTLKISILTGRDDHIRKTISENCLDILKKSFPESFEKLKLSITVQINEMDKGTYSREVNY